MALLSTYCRLEREAWMVCSSPCTCCCCCTQVEDKMDEEAADDDLLPDMDSHRSTTTTFPTAADRSAPAGTPGVRPTRSTRAAGTKAGAPELGTAGDTKDSGKGDTLDTHTPDNTRARNSGPARNSDTGAGAGTAGTARSSGTARYESPAGSRNRGPQREPSNASPAVNIGGGW
jgi:hypothetical protein